MINVENMLSKIKTVLEIAWLAAQLYMLTRR